MTKKFHRCEECKTVFTTAELEPVSPEKALMEESGECPSCGGVCFPDNVELMPKFDEKRKFRSPDAAADYCECFATPSEKLLKIIKYNISVDELGFASECVLLMGGLEENLHPQGEKE
jgi:hypothetical protein